MMYIIFTIFYKLIHLTGNYAVAPACKALCRPPDDVEKKDFQNLPQRPEGPNFHTTESVQCQQWFLVKRGGSLDEAGG